MLSLRFIRWRAFVVTNLFDDYWLANCRNYYFGLPDVVLDSRSMANERPHPAKLRRVLPLKRLSHTDEQIIRKLKTAEQLTTPQAAMSPGQHLHEALPMDTQFDSTADGRRHMFDNVID